MSIKRFRVVTMVLLLFIGSVLGVYANSITAQAATIKLSKKEATVYIGDSFKLTLKNAKASKVKWKTSDNSVATVSKGNVTAVGEGTCKITATYNKKKYTCTVNAKIEHPSVVVYAAATNDYKGTVSFYIQNNSSKEIIMDAKVGAENLSVKEQSFFNKGTYYTVNRTCNLVNLYPSAVQPGETASFSCFNGSMASVTSMTTLFIYFTYDDRSYYVKYQVGQDKGMLYIIRDKTSDDDQN